MTEGTEPFARALEDMLEDARLTETDGSPLYLPCGDEAAAVGARWFVRRPGTRPDLPLELEVPIPAGTRVVVGILRRPVTPPAISIDEEVVFMPEAPSLDDARVVRRP